MEKFRCIIHGSYRKHFDLIQDARRIFTEAGIEVLAPEQSELSHIKDKFLFLNTDTESDPRIIELLYLQNLKKLGKNGFSYFVIPNGYIGKTTSYELAVAQYTNIRSYFSDKIDDLPAYQRSNSIWKPEQLVEYIHENDKLPEPNMLKNDRRIEKLYQDLILPGSVVAVGGIIKLKDTDNVLLVRTHKWQDKFSIVGGRVRRSERLEDALGREVFEETGLDVDIKEHICTFDQIKKSSYHDPAINHIFVDKVVEASDFKVKLNEEAQGYVWIEPKMALDVLDIEPNARHTLELYTKMATV